MPALRVHVSELSDEHLAATREWLEDDTLRRQLDSLGPVPDEEENRRYWDARRADDRRLDFAILLGESDEHVGNCGLVVDRLRRKAELWLYVRPAAQRAGAGRAGVNAVLDIAFGSLDLHRVFVRVLLTNEPGLRFWRGCGFVDEGVLRADTWHDGRPVDAAVLSLLAPEWRAR